MLRVIDVNKQIDIGEILTDDVVIARDSAQQSRPHFRSSTRPQN